MKNLVLSTLAASSLLLGANTFAQEKVAGLPKPSFKWWAA